MAPRSSRTQPSLPFVPGLKRSAVTLLRGLLFFALTRVASAQTIWNTPQSGDWFQTANWSDGIPDSATDAQINNGGTPQIDTATAAANNLTLGFGAGDFGNLIVSGGGSLQVTDGLSVGLAGIGNLTIQDGAIVTDDTAAIGSFPVTSAGTVVVDGAGSTWSNNASLSVGGFGVGSLQIFNGGAVTASDCSLAGPTHIGGGIGSVLVDGAGSSLSCTQAISLNGSIEVQNGGAVVSDSVVVNGGVNLYGAGSTWTTGAVFIAPSTYGSLTIRNGAILTSDDLAYISGGPFSGVVMVDGPGSRWDHDFDQVQLYVGFGDLGVLDITNGGVVSTFAAGIGATSDGQVTVDGANSALNVRTNLYVGGADLGDGQSQPPGPQPGPQPGGVALVQISNGGVITSAFTTIFGRGSLIDDNILTSALTNIFRGGSLSGEGTVTGDIQNQGSVQPGDPMGAFTVDGNFLQYSPGTLVMEISGLDADAHDFLSITGDATFDGTVEVRFTGGFLPVQGQVFELIDVSGSVSLPFAHVIFPDLRSGFQFNPQFVNGRYQITALSDGAPAAGLLNISTRGQVGVDDDVLIAGFIVTGTTDKQVLIRGLGPSLAANGITDPLADPTLELRDQTGALITFNDNWMDSPQRQAIIDSMLAPSDDREAAILATLAPGSYTAILRGAGGGTGLGIVEVYNLGPDLSSSLANISTRGLVNTGDQVLIGGFIVDDQNSIVLLRGLGPSLTSAGVADALANPTLELHNGDGDVIALSNDWQSTDEAIIQNTGLAPQFSEESAILVTLGPGAFTAILRGFDDSSGVGLFEAYNLR
jgi:T5SS/PEP-CTERM-associated repeat protein